MTVHWRDLLREDIHFADDRYKSIEISLENKRCVSGWTSRKKRTNETEMRHRGKIDEV